MAAEKKSSARPAKKNNPGKDKSIKEPLTKELYSLLACPDCKSDVRYNATKSALVCVKCRANYPIKRGIPVMLPKGMQ